MTYVLLAETVNGVTRNTSYTYDADNRIKTVTTDGVTTSYTYDTYGRIYTKTVKSGSTQILKETYTYHGSTSGMPANWVYRIRSQSPGRDVTYTYNYDKNGNITSASDGTYTTVYGYDSAGQLTRENNQELGKTWVWTYDDAGNIKNRKEYAYTTGTLGAVLSTKDYTYGDSSWGDLLTGYDGWTFSYDSIGNLTQAGTFTYTWEHGRQLANMTSSTADIDFTYDSNGMRVGKTVTTVTETTEPEEPEDPVVPTYTVTFKADGVTVDTITVNSGYTLTAADYPTVPAKDGYTGAWNQYTSPVTSNITIQAVYTQISGGGEEAETHTVTFRVSYGSSYGYTVKTMEVEDGYVLTASDYPSGTGMSSITWEQYTSPIHSDITINGSYSWGGMNADENAELMGSGEGEASAATAAVTTTTTVTDYDYTYNGGQLTGEVITTTVDGTVTNTETLYYSYDAGGTPVSVKYNNTLYFYVTNLQGDVTAIMNSSGTVVVEYTYDAWGFIRNTTGSLKDTLGKANALRYRGYVYDTETGLYYLQSRYYNPGTGRFINADALVSTGQGLLGNNMFAYCNNNPVVLLDIEGKRPVAIGFQFEVTTNGVSIGFEIVVFFDPVVCKDSSVVICCYTYSGSDVSLESIMGMESIISVLSTVTALELGSMDQDTLLFLGMALMEGIDVSGSFFFIDGNEKFDEPNDYSGSFDTVYFTGSFCGKNAGMYYSECDTCFAVGIKVGISTPKPRLIPIDFGYSRTFYSEAIEILRW